MNITPEMMYWLTRCDNICTAGFIFSVLFGIGAVMSTMFVFNETESVKFFHKIFCVIAILLFFISLATCVFVPTTREMAAIYVVPAIANSETVKDLGEGVVTLAREWIQELRPNKTKGGAK